MIVQMSRHVLKHVVGGGGIFDAMANNVRKITGNTVGDLASKLLVSASKSTASETGKILATRFIALPPAMMSLPEAQPVGEPVHGPTSAFAGPSNHQAKVDEIIAKYNAGSGLVLPALQLLVTLAAFREL